MEEVHDVELNNNASFYRAILAVHKENYTLAMSLIHETREQLSGTYDRALCCVRVRVRDRVLCRYDQSFQVEVFF